VDGRRIVQYARYDSLDLALAETGLNDSDEVLEEEL
jgi:hypothetical protein